MLILDYQFRELPPPEPPFPICGADSTDDDLPCPTSSRRCLFFTPASEVNPETPFSIPPLDTDEIDVMLDEAFEDDEVTADEIAAVLEVAGVEPELARCEADLLVSLGVEDVSGGIELQQALDAMTDEDHQQLEACFNG